MWRLLLTALMLSSFISTSAQQNVAVIDSFKQRLTKAQTSKDKIYLMGNLARTLMTVNLAEADKYGSLMNQEAELSRDRSLMVQALMTNGERYSYFTTNKDYIQKSIGYYNKALEVAKQNKLDKETAEVYLALAAVHTRVPDLDRSFNYATQASAITSTLKDDSLKVANYYTYGMVYQLKKERILALRNYLLALRLAEESKDHTLMRNCYSMLSQFYADIKSYDKAIDFAKKAADELPATNLENKAYLGVADLYTMGNLYMGKKDFDMSVYYFDKAVRGADSLKYSPLKMAAYNGLLNQYLRSEQPQKALEFFNTRTDLKQYINTIGSGYIVDHAYGVIYTELGRYDSAKYYFDKASPGFEATITPAGKISFYGQYADFYKKSGDMQKAIEYFTKAKQIADQTGDLDWQQRIAKQLDTAYAKAGDFKQSHFYSSLYHQYKDSLQKLSEEKDLLQMEIDDEQQRQARLDRERQEELRRKHNIQYMGITIAIATVFLFLVLLGIFQVSVSTIKIMGFFAFIFLFEFIILIADNQIHHWTHGEPLKVLAIKVVLIAMLLPLHHWLEHRVINYLTTKRLIIPVRTGFWKNILAKRNSEAN